jgi:hypothetical protein
VAVAKTQRRVARGGEGKQRVGPMVYGQNLFFVEGAHGVQVNSKEAIVDASSYCSGRRGLSACA